MANFDFVFQRRYLDQIFRQNGKLFAGHWANKTGRQSVNYSTRSGSRIRKPIWVRVDRTRGRYRASPRSHRAEAAIRGWEL